MQCHVFCLLTLWLPQDSFCDPSLALSFYTTHFFSVCGSSDAPPPTIAGAATHWWLYTVECDKCRQKKVPDTVNRVQWQPNS